MKAKSTAPEHAGPAPLVNTLLDSSSQPAKPNSVLSHSGAFVDPEQRKAMIAEAAYYRAEHRGFASGFELDDWLAAEVDSALAHDSLPSS